MPQPARHPPGWFDSRVEIAPSKVMRGRIGNLAFA